MNKRSRLFTVLLLLLIAASIAITQESSELAEEEEDQYELEELPFIPEEYGDEPEIPPEPLPEWVSPARWFRSNSAGMMLEEIQSRLAAMRNEYALVIDFISRDELPEILLPYYDNHYIEIRALYQNGLEYRRQWIFRDANGLYRLIAVFTEAGQDKEDSSGTDGDEAALDENMPLDSPEQDAGTDEVSDAYEEDGVGGDGSPFDIIPWDTAQTQIADKAAVDTRSDDAAQKPIADKAAVDARSDNAAQKSIADKAAVNTRSDDAAQKPIADKAAASDEGLTESHDTEGLAGEGSETEIEAEEILNDHRVSVFQSFSGFIEIYGDDFLLERELVFSGEDNVRETVYTYRRGTLIMTEVLQNIRKEAGMAEAGKIFTDTYRYNRSGSLRSIERTYHERVEEEKVSLRFANRVLDAAANSMFHSDQLFLSSDFFEDFFVEPEQKMVFTSDERHRILTQTLLDSEGEVIWVIKNTWSGDRIASALRIQGDDQKLNEYEYNSKGDRIVERNLHNGVLQRQVFSEDGRDTEELFMNGVVVLRAVWEEGRKVSEQLLRPGETEQVKNRLARPEETEQPENKNDEIEQAENEQ